MIVHATRSQIESLKNSIIWKDIVRELRSWEQTFPDEIDSIVRNAEEENPSSANVLMHIGCITGRKDTIALIIGILDTFLSLKQMEVSKDE